MARWKKLMLASALAVWPVVCGAQGLGESAGGSMAAGSAVRPGLFDTSRAAGGGAPSASSALKSGSVAPNVSGMPVAEGVMPASHAGCGDKSGCFAPCDAAGGGNWGVTSMSTDGPCGFVVMGEALWLKMRRQDPIVLQTYTNFDGNTYGALSDYQTDYEFGFRVGGGYLARSGFLFTAMYTRFESSSKTQTFEVDSPDGSSSILYVGPGVFASDLQFSQGVLQTKWEYNYQTLDLMMGAVISPSSCMDIIVNGGVRLANLTQLYQMGANITPEVPTEIREDLHLEIQGAGPRVGTEARLYLTKCCMVYGRSYGSLLIASREEQSFSTVADFNGTSFRYFTYTREEIMPVLELAAGIEVSLCEGQILLGAGYEWNFLWEAGATNVDFASNARFNRHVNLALDGFAARCSFLW